LPGIAVDLGQQPANRIALKYGIALRALAVFAIADFVQANQVATGVIAEASGQVVHPHLFAEAVRGIVGKAVGCTVLVDQGGQAQGLVVFVADPLRYCEW